ncbi:MAG: RNA polymerase sigma factor [Planctomycetota bacterium]
MTAEKKPQPAGTDDAPLRPAVGSLSRSAPLPSEDRASRHSFRASGSSSPPVDVLGAARSKAGRGAHDGDGPDPAREPMLRAQQGDQDGFRTLVEMFQNRVMRVMVSVLRCDRAMAEDLCQEVFLRVHKGLPKFDGEVPFAAWLHTISMNVAISEYRRRRAQKRDKKTLSIDAPIGDSDDFYITPPSDERDPSDQVHRADFLRRVRECVRDLPDEYREAVVLRDMESLSYEEIGDALGLLPGTVRSRIHRGRLLLQQKLKEFRP